MTKLKLQYGKGVVPTAAELKLIKYYLELKTLYPNLPMIMYTGKYSIDFICEGDGIAYVDVETYIPTNKTA